MSAGRAYQSMHLHKIIGSVKHVDDNLSQISVSRGTCGTIISNDVMKSGKHYFSLPLWHRKGWTMVDMGVMRPIQHGISEMEEELGDVFTSQLMPLLAKRPLYGNRELITNFFNPRRQDTWKGTVDCCSYNTNSQVRHFSDWGLVASGGGYEGERNLTTSFDWVSSLIPYCTSMHNDTIGLLLDLDEGTLSIFSNGYFRGVIKDGLDGHYSWMLRVERTSQSLSDDVNNQEVDDPDIFTCTSVCSVCDNTD